MTREKLAAHLQKARDEYQFWLVIERLREDAARRELGAFPDSVYRAYLVSDSVTEAAKLLNAQGQRYLGRRFYPADISRVIRLEDASDPEVTSFVRELLGRK